MACRGIAGLLPRLCLGIACLPLRCLVLGLPASPVDLLVDLKPSPVLGLDTLAPRFAWALSCQKRSTVSVAYQIVVQHPNTAAASPDLLWDSGKVEGNASTNVAYEGKPLASSTTYTWKVRWWSNHEPDPSDFSEAAVFVTGILGSADWGDAALLTCAHRSRGEAEGASSGGGQCRHLRTEFSVGSPFVEAFVHVAAMGWVEVRINGVKAGGDAVLEPGWTQYDTRLLYATYNVSGLLQGPGRNALAIVLGNGWPGHLGHTPTFKLRLVVLLANGQRQAITSSTAAGWNGTFGGPILLDDIFGGETYDAREELDGFDAAGYDAAAGAWVPAASLDDPSIGKAVLSSQPMAPIRALELLPAISISVPAPGVYVADFGQNIAGWVRLQLQSCPRGVKIKLSFGELVHKTDHPDPVCSCPTRKTCGFGSDCCQYMENGTSRTLVPHHNCTWRRGMVNQQYLNCIPGRSVTGDRCAVDFYTCKGDGPEVYEPRFTYHGFRFAQFEGFPGDLLSSNVSARVVHSDVGLQAESGRPGEGSLTFKGSASGGLAQLQSNIRWTQLNNLHSIPTDCHQRTERQGWMADASVSAEEALHNFWMPSFYQNFLRTIADVQTDFPPKDPLDKRPCLSQYGRSDCRGAVPEVVPHPVGQGVFGRLPGDPSWMVGLALVAWYHLRYTGDRAAAREHYESVSSFADFMLSCGAKNPDGLCQYWAVGDWLEPHCDPAWPVDHAGPMCRSDLRNRMTSAFSSILAVRIARDFAQVLGVKEDEGRFEIEEEKLLQRWNATYYDVAHDTFGDGSQTALTFSLLALAPANRPQASQLRSKLLKQLVDAVRSTGDHVTTGIIATKWMPEALSQAGRADVALDLVLQPTAPSWLDQVRQDATTVWEMWQYADGPASNSHCHPALASIGAWFYRWLAGIRIAEHAGEPGFGAGYSHVTLAPAVLTDPKLTGVSADVPTAQGTVSLSWAREGEKLQMNVTLPANTQGEVHLPPGLCRLFEGPRLLWSKGSVGAYDDGLSVEDNMAAGLIVRTGSGSYKFLAEFAGSAADFPPILA